MAEPGPPTCTSEASTGSVGESTAPSSRAVAGARPSAAQPTSATAATLSGSVMTSSRQVCDHRRHVEAQQVQRPVDGQPDAHQRAQHGELGDVLDQQDAAASVTSTARSSASGVRPDEHADEDQHEGGGDGEAAQRGREGDRQQQADAPHQEDDFSALMSLLHCRAAAPGRTSPARVTVPPLSTRPSTARRRLT